MRVLSAISSVETKLALAEAVRVLACGGVVAHPTDTVFGLAADFSNAKAIAKIHALKKTISSKPLLVMLPNKSWLPRLGQKLCRAKQLAARFWPGQLALIVQAKNPTSKKCEPPQTIGVRLPGHALTLALIRNFGRPLVTTSANLTRQAPARRAAEVQEIFARQKIQPDLILDDGSVTVSEARPSTIVDVSRPGVWKILRVGQVSAAAIAKVL